MVLIRTKYYIIIILINVSFFSVSFIKHIYTIVVCIIMDINIINTYLEQCVSKAVTLSFKLNTTILVNKLKEKTKPILIQPDCA